MSIMSALGSSALSGGMSNLIGSANSIHLYENDNAGFFGVVDPLGTGFGHMLNSSAKKQAKKQLAYNQAVLDQQYAMQKQAALEMPALVRRGFEDAGYNALLALGQTGGATSSMSASAHGQFPDAIKERNVNPLFISALETAQAQRRQIKAQTDKTKVETVTNAIATLGKIAGVAIAAKALSKKFGAAAANASKSAPLVNIPMKKVSGKLAEAAAASGSLGAGAGIARTSALGLPLLGIGAAAGYAKLMEYLADTDWAKNIHPKVNPNTLRHRTSGLSSSPKSDNNVKPKRKHN